MTKIVQVISQDLRTEMRASGPEFDTRTAVTLPP